MNIDIDAFTYITGLASLLGLLIQFKDGFAEHRETRKAIVFLIVGVFVGSLISAARGMKVEMGATIAPMHALIAFVTVVIAFVAVAAVFVKEAERRGELFAFTGLGAVVLLVLLFGAAVGGAGGKDREISQLTLEELMYMADAAETKGNFARALTFLGQARSTLISSDTRVKLIEDRQAAIRSKQVPAAK